MEQTLSGVIERITYHNEENGYTIARLQDETGRLVTVVGKMVGISVGSAVELRGNWRQHPQYGQQFKTESFKTTLPATITGIEKYLGSGLIKGVGPVTAKRIVRRFGLDTLRLIDEEPERLIETPGVGRKRVEMIKQAWAEQRDIKDLMIFLQGHGVSTNLAVKIYKYYGDAAIGVLQADPYRLQRDIFGIGFLTADKIAQSLGIPHDSPARVAAGISYVLQQQTGNGHVYSPRRELVAAAVELLGVDAEQVASAITQLRTSQAIHMETLPGANDETIEAVYLLPTYYAEKGVAERLRLLNDARLISGSTRLSLFERYSWQQTLAHLQQELGLTLAPAQAQAIETALSHPVTVLTGGPGTGKTTTLHALIHLLQQAGKRFALAAPTGRAAKRMSEATGQTAKTIHRLLEVNPAEGFSFRFDAQNPLQLDMLIIDEASMLDITLTHHLLRAIPQGAHLLLVGDIDQLPSVGPGNVLRDIIDSGVVAVERLHLIFRQAEDSAIITNAHRIIQGQMPALDKQAHDFFLFHIEDVDQCADMVIDLVAQRIPRRFGIPSRQIQVLSPMHRGAVGVATLNQRLQQRLNPADPRRPERTLGGRVFRVGDRVMQTRNNYELDVFNGDMGEITTIDPVMHTLAIRIDDREVSYDWLDADELVHAWAVSVHKSQGSEYRAVVIPFHTTHYVMLQRHLLYTAVTRARELVVLVGTRRALGIAVRNDAVAERYTALAYRLRTGN
ncbi:MAG: ATP-dependent RecD-like DNA helicase [Chloroflexi bacterium]|nr:ATP-dependent RecD-like DNA helicase [Chloroflexota bacterium]